MKNKQCPLEEICISGGSRVVLRLRELTVNCVQIPLGIKFISLSPKILTIPNKILKVPKHLAKKCIFFFFNILYDSAILII